MPELETALLDDICQCLSQGFDPCRFVPYVVMHEFEGLLFSDAAGFANGIGLPDLMSQFQAIRNQFETPEEINDSSETAPSKRVARLVPGYEKPFMGTLAVLEIGLDAMRCACPLFNKWIMRLEQWLVLP